MGQLTDRLSAKWRSMDTTKRVVTGIIVLVIIAIVLTTIF